MAVGAKIAKTADRKKVMDTSKSTDCPKCGKTTRIVKRRTASAAFRAEFTFHAQHVSSSKSFSTVLDFYSWPEKRGSNSLLRLLLLQRNRVFMNAAPLADNCSRSNSLLQSHHPTVT
jgi:hypothetical protein